jgi:WD40 repeat protein
VLAPDTLTPGHTDAVWGLAVHHTHLLSCSADGTVRLWSPAANTKAPLVSTFTIHNGIYFIYLFISDKNIHDMISIAKKEVEIFTLYTIKESIFKVNVTVQAFIKTC